MPRTPFLATWRRVIQDVVQVEIARQLKEHAVQYITGALVRGPVPGASVPYGAAGYPVDVAETEADGTAALAARSDHRHAHGTGYLPNAHHAAVTLGAGSDAALTLSGQELTLTLPLSATLRYEVLVDAGGNAIVTESGDWIYVGVPA